VRQAGATRARQEADGRYAEGGGDGFDLAIESGLAPLDPLDGVERALIGRLV
jgi:hypothetical protein